MKTHIGIQDTANGRCFAELNIKGESFQCDLAAEHDGWAHSNEAADAIWAGSEFSVIPFVSQRRRESVS